MDPTCVHSEHGSGFQWLGNPCEVLNIWKGPRVGGFKMVSY
jgi:hypothetical protein